MKTRSFFIANQKLETMLTKSNSVKVLNFDSVGAIYVFRNENIYLICFLVAICHKKALRYFVLSMLNNYNTTY